MLATVLLVGWLIYVGVTKEHVVEYDTITAEKSNLVQEVSVSGRVKAVNNVDLGFAVGGRVSAIHTDVGDSVKIGDELVSLVADELKAQMRQAQASVSSAVATLTQYSAAIKTQQANLDELKKGIRPEEIQVTQTTANNANESYKDTQTNLENIKIQADANLNSVYTNVINDMQKAVDTAKTALTKISEIQALYYNSSDFDSNSIASAKSTAMNSLFGVSNAGKWTTQIVSTQTGGFYSEVQQMAIVPDYTKIESTLRKVQTILQNTKSALNSVPIKGNLTVADVTTLDTHKSNVDVEIRALNSGSQSITVQKITNTNSISTAETSVNTAKNTLDSAKSALSLKQAGYTPEQIKAKEAQVDQARANLSSQRAMVSQANSNVEYYKAQLEKTILRAPIDGVINKMEAKLGEIVLPSSSSYEIQTPLVSIISEGEYEVEVNVPEIDIAKVEIGDKAIVTLDAYGDDVEFITFVAKINPGETIMEGVATYETTLVFKEADDRVKSGMTADVSILTAEKDNVIVIPQRAVIDKDNKKIIRVLEMKMEKGKETKKLVEVEIETGLKGSMGEIEISKGIDVGDEIVLRIVNSE